MTNWRNFVNVSEWGRLCLTTLLIVYFFSFSWLFFFDCLSHFYFGHKLSRFFRMFIYFWFFKKPREQIVSKGKQLYIYFPHIICLFYWLANLDFQPLIKVKTNMQCSSYCRSYFLGLLPVSQFGLCDFWHSFWFFKFNNLLLSSMSIFSTPLLCGRGVSVGTWRFGHSTSSALIVSAIVPVRPHFLKTFRPWFYLCCFMCYL